MITSVRDLRQAAGHHVRCLVWFLVADRDLRCGRRCAASGAVSCVGQRRLSGRRPVAACAFACRGSDRADHSPDPSVHCSCAFAHNVGNPADRGRGARAQSEFLLGQQCTERDEAVCAGQDLSAGLAYLAERHPNASNPDPIGNPFPARDGDLREWCNDLVVRLDHLVGQVGAGAHGLQTSARDLASTADRTAFRARQARTLQRSVASLPQLSGSLRETAGLAQQADKAMVANRAEAQKGTNVLARVSRGPTVLRLRDATVRVRQVRPCVQPTSRQMPDAPDRFPAKPSTLETRQAGSGGSGHSADIRRC